MKHTGENKKEQLYRSKREAGKGFKERALDVLIITGAAAIYAVGVSCFTDPNQLAPGGVTGLAIVMNRIIGIETGTLIFLLNVPILILGIWKFGIHFILSTMYAIIVISGFTNLFQQFGPITRDRLLASIAGGVISAFSISIILRRGGTTGGTDIIVKCMKIKYPYLKTGMLFLILDVIIVVLSAIIFQDFEIALYAGISIVVTSKVMDLCLYGNDEAKMLWIISDQAETLVNRILDNLDVGATILNGIGAYSKQDKKVILCVVKKTVFPLVEELVRNEDEQSFLIVSRASEIYGLGYKSFFTPKL